MTAASVPVDLFNPGQVFACLGFMELAERLIGPQEAGFDWSCPSETRFLLCARDEDPFAVALRFLAQANVQALVPRGWNLGTGDKQISSRESEGGSFPVPLPSSPASLPAVLTAQGASVLVASWGEVNLHDMLTTKRDNVKFWAGSGGYPGAGLLRDALDAVRSELCQARDDPFSLSALQTSSFRFDWRRDYIPIDAGFSLNEHARIQPLGYPLVEVLAAIGLAHARPMRVTKLEYGYGVVGRSGADQPEDQALLPAPFIRAALGRAELPFPTRTFTMKLDWPGKENQARCITTVQEDTIR